MNTEIHSVELTMNDKLDNIIRSLRSLKKSNNILQDIKQIDFYDFDTLKESIVYKLTENNTKSSLNKCIEEIRESRKEAAYIIDNNRISHDDDLDTAKSKYKNLINSINNYTSQYYLSYLETIDQKYFNDVELSDNVF